MMHVTNNGCVDGTCAGGILTGDHGSKPQFSVLLLLLLFLDGKCKMSAKAR